MSEKVKLSYKGKDFEFPLVEGSENEKGIDIKSLRSQTGLITYDPGYKNTGSCKSDITFLDGEEGILRYRGYSIEDLCEKASFIEVAFLLIFGDMPSKKRIKLF
jgi:citrate synthase